MFYPDGGFKGIVQRLYEGLSWSIAVDGVSRKTYFTSLYLTVRLPFLTTGNHCSIRQKQPDSFGKISYLTSQNTEAADPLLPIVLSDSR